MFQEVQKKIITTQRKIEEKQIVGKVKTKETQTHTYDSSHAQTRKASTLIA